MKHKIAIIILVITILFSMFSVSANNDLYYQVVVDGTYIPWKDGRPYIDENDRLMVPVRAAAEIIGADVIWDNDTQTASITKHFKYSGDCPAQYHNDTTYASEVTVSFKLHSATYTINAPSIGVNETSNMDTTAVVRNSRIFVPIRYLAEPLGYVVEWNVDTAILRNSNYKHNGVSLMYTMDERPLAEMFLKMVSEMVIYNTETAVLTAPYKISGTEVRHAFDEMSSRFRYECLEESCYAPSRSYSSSTSGKQTAITLSLKDFRDSKRAGFSNLASQYLTDLYENNTINRNMSQTERAEAIAEALCDSLEYETADELSYTGWAAFTRGKANCQGYTSAYNMLLELDGIETFCIDGYNTNVAGERHCWTKAVLDGEERYFDTTWGSNYFLLSEAAMYSVGYRAE